MKAIKILLCSALFLILSCKRDAGKIDCWFNLNPSETYRDSISSIVINYSVFRDDETLMNPDIYQYSIKTNSKRSNCDVYPCSVDYGSIILETGHTYVIKKFDLIDPSGKLLFYLPWKSDSLNNATDVTYLPYVFKADSRIFLDFSKFIKAVR